MNKKILLYSNGSFTTTPDARYFNSEDEYTEFVTKQAHRLRNGETYIKFESTGTITSAPNAVVVEGTVPEDKVYSLVPALEEGETEEIIVNPKPGTQTVSDTDPIINLDDDNPEVPSEGQTTPGQSTQPSSNPGQGGAFVIDDETTGDDILDHLKGGASEGSVVNLDS